jgi:hypothetical protein
VQPVRHFFHIPAVDNDYHPALRIMLGVGIPLLLLVASDRMDLAVFATLGAFTGVYGRGVAHRARFSQQWRAGLVMLAAIAAGLSASHAELGQGSLIAGTAVVGALGSAIARLGRFKPTGSLFFVFGFSAIAFMASPAAVLEGIGVAAATVVLSLVLGVAGWVLPGHQTTWVRVRPPQLDRDERSAVYGAAMLHLVTVWVAGTVAGWTGFGHSYWAMIAATVPLHGAITGHGVSRGIHRIIGTIGGLVIAGILLGLGLEGMGLAAVVLVLQFLVELFVTRHYALAQMFVTPLALLMTEAAAPMEPWALMLERLVETVIGASVGIAFVLLVNRLRKGAGGRGGSASEGEQVEPSR